MAEIKTTIALLCKFLKLLYGCNMKNEHFRLAKFNSTEENTVSHFWQLLYMMCPENKLKSFNIDNTVNTVKLNLALLKYDSLLFYTLPTDMSSGSRELLLAFSWLLVTQNILEKATKNRIIKNRISKEYGDFDLRESSEESQQMNINVNSLCNVSNTVLWYAGKLRHNLKAVDELSQECIRITNKIHDETKNTCGLPHLSAGDVKLIYDNNDSPVEYKHLKDGALLIETNRNWLKKEAVFWQWMGTVIEEREKNSSQSLDGESIHALLSFTRVLKGVIDVAKAKNTSNISGLVNFNFEDDVEAFSGVPRYIKQDDSESELGKLLLDSAEQIDKLEKEYVSNFQIVKCWLDNIQKKLNGITIVNM